MNCEIDCYRLLDSKEGTKITKGTRKQDQQDLGKSGQWSFFGLVFSICTFPTILEPEKANCETNIDAMLT